MSKFKVGDVVVLTEDYQGVEAGTILTIAKGEASHSPRDQGLWTASGLPCSVFGRRLELYSRPIDDELPPAPESVEYTELAKNGSFDIARLRVFTHYTGEGLIVHSPEGILLTPDEVLQLCHDLRRMAMSIKRKEKQNV